MVATTSGARSELLGEEDAVARHVLGVLLGVAVLGVDGEDQPLEDVEGARLRLRLERPAGDPDGVAAARLGLLEGQRHHRQEGRDRVGVIRVDAHAGADGQRQPLGRLELQRVVDEDRPQALEDLDHRRRPSRPAR